MLMHALGEFKCSQILIFVPAFETSVEALEAPVNGNVLLVEIH